MKVLFIAVNSKYIHTSPAVRILSSIASREFDSTYKEFTIKDNINHIIEYAENYDVIGLSCYIWNISIMKEIASNLKKSTTDKIVFAGGPEVSYEPNHFTAFFDYVLCGEGEELIIPFLRQIKKGHIPNLTGIASRDNPTATTVLTEDFNNIPAIFDLYSADDLKNRIIYLELSRGCPFQCSYCLSSLEKGVRNFSDERIEATFQFIETNQFKCVKFLDRTFNLYPDKFLKICRRLEKTDNTYQFEIEASLFNEEVIHYLCEEVTPNKFRLEIGIQSLNEKAIQSVHRHQDNEKLLSTVERINKSNRCTVHIDLIAGLPYEDLESFIHSFNTSFLLECEELQLGFLKMLRGTEIRREADRFGYIYSSSAPYEVIENEFISKDEMDEIHKCEETLEWLWNGKNAVHLIKHLIKDNLFSNWFQFFVGFYPYFNKKAPLQNNYEKLLDYLNNLQILKKEYIDDLKYDYLSRVKIRPQPFWKKYAYEEFKEIKTKLCEEFGQNKNSFSTSYYDGYLVIDYENSSPELKIIK